MGQNFSSEPVVEKETERAENATFKAAISSCQGWRMSQEDNHSLMLDLPQSEHKASFFAVYDGHGSARVSKHASEGLWRHLTNNQNYKQGNFKEALEEAFLSFDKEVYESYTAQLAGTTAVSVLVVDNVIYCANIGDSRAVAAINCECEPLSHDHKPDNPEELKRITAAGGYVLGNRVNGNLALSRAFGDFHYKNNENLSPEDQIVSSWPDIKRIELNDDVDFILLACDGIWDVLTSEEVVKFVISRLEQNMEPGLICEQLTTRCLATNYELVIGCDNMTVLLVCHTRGQSWPDYCTNIFEKNTKKLGVPRTRSFNPADLEDDTDVHTRRQQQLREQQLQQQQHMHEQDFSPASGFGGNQNRGRDEEGSARVSSSDGFASHIPQDIRILLDAIQNLHTDEDNSSSMNVVDQSSSDDSSSRIHEVPLNDNETEDSAAESEVGRLADGGESGTSVVNEAVELHLKALDTLETDQIATEQVTIEAAEIKAAEEANPEVVSNTVEVELAAPENSSDEVPDPIIDTQPQGQETGDADIEDHADATPADGDKSDDNGDATSDE